MKKLRFFGLLVTVLLLAFGLTVACDNGTTTEETVDPTTSRYTDGNIEIIFSNQPIARVRALSTGDNYVIREGTTQLSKGTIEVLDNVINILFKEEVGGATFRGQLANNRLIISDTLGSGRQLIVSATDPDTGGGVSGSGGGGGGGGGSGGGGGTTPPANVVQMVNLTVRLPSAGVTGASGAFDASAPGATSYSVGSTTWNPAVATGAGAPVEFKPRTVYTVSVNVTATSPFTFPSGAGATINGNVATVTNRTSSSMTVSYTFPQTTDLVYDIKLNSQTNKWKPYEVDDVLNFVGLAVDLMYVGTTRWETVQAAQFSQKGITMTVSGSGITAASVQVGDKATHDMDGGLIYIEAGAGGKQNWVETSNTLGVVKKVLNVRSSNGSVVFGSANFKGVSGGASADIEILKIPSLFSGIPSDIQIGSGAGEFRVVTGAQYLTTGDATVSGGDLNVTKAGDIFIGFTIGTSEPKYDAIPSTHEVVSKLTVQKGTIKVTPLTGRSKVYTASGVSVALYDLYSFTMNDSMSTIVSPALFNKTTVGDTTTGSFQITANSPAIISGGAYAGWSKSLEGNAPFVEGTLTVGRTGTFGSTFSIASTDSAVAGLYNAFTVPGNTFTVTKIPITSIAISLPALTTTTSLLANNVNFTVVAGPTATAVTSAQIKAPPLSTTPAGTALTWTSSPQVISGGALAPNTQYTFTIPIDAIDIFNGFSTTGGTDLRTVVTISGSAPMVIDNGWTRSESSTGIDRATITIKLFTPQL
jgi:hypothetical protein